MLVRVFGLHAVDMCITFVISMCAYTYVLCREHKRLCFNVRVTWCSISPGPGFEELCLSSNLLMLHPPICIVVAYHTYMYTCIRIHCSSFIVSGIG